MIRVSINKSYTLYNDKKGNKKGGWLIFSRDGGLKSRKNIRESRDNGVKVITRLDSNFVVRMFGNIGSDRLDKMNIGSMESTEVLGKVLS
jgi:hypothetical protein